MSQRFTVGQRTPFIVFDVKRGDRFGGPAYVPWTDELRSMTVLNLLCDSHHRVPCHWLGEKDPQRYDGYIFLDDTGREWHNQYPDYSNQQLSDENDWNCHRHMTDQEYEADTSKWPVVHAYHAVHHIERVERGIHDLRKMDGTEKEVGLLEQHLKDVIEAVERVTGKVVLRRPLTARWNDGHVTVIPHVIDAELIEPVLT